MACKRRPESEKVRPKYSFTNSRESTLGGTAVAVAAIVIIFGLRTGPGDSIPEPRLQRAGPAPEPRCRTLDASPQGRMSGAAARAARKKTAELSGLRRRAMNAAVERTMPSSYTNRRLWP